MPSSWPRNESVDKSGRFEVRMDFTKLAVCKAASLVFGVKSFSFRNGIHRCLTHLERKAKFRRISGNNFGLTYEV